MGALWRLMQISQVGSVLEQCGERVSYPMYFIQEDWPLMMK